METNRHNPEVAAPQDSNPPPLLRCGVGGVLMGLANLVPGVSGGTMILVVGLYDEFISSLADVCRFRFTKRNITFLLIVGWAAAVAIVTLSGTLSRAVTLHRSAMYSLFIGLTLGGAPLLGKMLKRPCRSSVFGVLVGLAIMIFLAVFNDEPPDRAATKEAVAAGEFVIVANWPKDLVAGALGMSAMVLPGVSGAYMLLILGRYEAILASVAVAGKYATSMGSAVAPMTFLAVIIPTGIGAVVSLVVLSNVLKWLLHTHKRGTLGVLLGILLGSAVGIWPFESGSTAGDYLTGGVLVLVGFACTFGLSRIK